MKGKKLKSMLKDIKKIIPNLDQDAIDEGIDLFDKLTKDFRKSLKEIEGIDDAELDRRMKKYNKKLKKKKT